MKENTLEEIIEISKTTDDVITLDNGQIVFKGNVFNNKEDFLKWIKTMNKSINTLKKLNPRNWFKK